MAAVAQNVQFRLPTDLLDTVGARVRELVNEPGVDRLEIVELAGTVSDLMRFARATWERFNTRLASTGMPGIRASKTVNAMTEILDLTDPTIALLNQIGAAIGTDLGLEEAASSARKMRQDIA